MLHQFRVQQLYARLCRAKAENPLSLDSICVLCGCQNDEVQFKTTDFWQSMRKSTLPGSGCEKAADIGAHQSEPNFIGLVRLKATETTLGRLKESFRCLNHTDGGEFHEMKLLSRAAARDVECTVNLTFSYLMGHRIVN